MKITLQLFGAFRPHGDKLELELADSATVADICPALCVRLPDMEEVIQASRFASKTQVLPETTTLEDGMVLAIIPPVSGG